MKVEYVYVVFFILSLVYKWYKGKNKELTENEKELPEDPSPTNTASSPSTFEDLIHQFEAAYGETKRKKSGQVSELTAEKPKEKEVEVKRAVSAVKSTAKKTAHVAQAKVINDSVNSSKEIENKGDLQELDLEEMVIHAAILNRPYS